MTFDLFGPGDETCTNPIHTSTVSVEAYNVYYQSSSVTVSEVGQYRWVVSYSGDVNNQAVATELSSCWALIHHTPPRLLNRTFDDDGPSERTCSATGRCVDSGQSRARMVDSRRGALGRTRREQTRPRILLAVTEIHPKGGCYRRSAANAYRIGSVRYGWP